MTLVLKNVSKTFGGIKALDDVSLSIKKGHITGLIGPNGCGKTTLFNVITHATQKDKGNIFLGKTEITNMAAQEVASLGIARTFQEVRLFHNLTIKQHMLLASSKTDQSLFKSLFKKAHHPKKKIHDTLALVGLTLSKDTYASDLSYGQRKLLTIAMVIMQKHKVLLLDEPVAGVNPKLRKKIKNIILALKKKGETIFIIEHDMNFIMNLADEIIAMQEGRILLIDKPSIVKNDKRVLQSYLGE